MTGVACQPRRCHHVIHHVVGSCNQWC